MEINNFQGNLTDISAKKEALECNISFCYSAHGLHVNQVMSALMQVDTTGVYTVRYTDVLRFIGLR